MAPTTPLQLAKEIAAGVSDVAKGNAPKPAADSASAMSLMDLRTVFRDSPFIFNFAPQQWDGEQFGRFLIVLALMFSLIFGFPTLIRAVVAIIRRKPVTLGSDASFDWKLLTERSVQAEACRELMKEVATEMMRASGTVNSLRGLPVLQNALYRELDSTRKLLGFAAQVQGNSGEQSDWHRIKSQLIASLQETQRIIGIAEAARASFSFQPAALPAITTRPEAYAFLGVNAAASETVLKKIVDALRQCWHPDFATDEEDRRQREIRTKQINVAWDLISQKQISAQ